MQDDKGRDTVVLKYGLTRDQVLDAVAAQYRVTRRPWYLRTWFLVLLVAIGVLSFIALLAPVADGRFPAVVIAGPLIPVAIAVVYANPRLLFRGAARQLLRGNPSLTLPTTVTVSGSGIRSANAVGEMAVNWTHYPYYTKTASMVVLFTSDRFGGAMQPLPLRGLGSDSQPLYTLLAARSQRLG